MIIDIPVKLNEYLLNWPHRFYPSLSLETKYV